MSQTCSAFRYKVRCDVRVAAMNIADIWGHQALVTWLCPMPPNKQYLGQSDKMVLHRLGLCRCPCKP